MFPPELQVVKFVAEVNGGFGTRWRVFTTGSSRHYLFSCVQNPEFAVPVLKADLDQVRESRLALCALTLRALVSGLGLLGVPVPERM